METHEMIEKVAGFEDIQDVVAMVPAMRKLPVVEVGEILGTLDETWLPGILEKFTPEQQGLIVSEFPVEKQIVLFQSVSKKRFAPVFINMPSELRADLFQKLTRQEQIAILPFLPKVVREDVIHLASYPPETAGGIMSTDFATVQRDMTCAEALDKVRSDNPSNKTIYYIYVVDDDQLLQGFITLKDLVIATPETPVPTILHDEFAFAYAGEDREEVAKKIEKYDLVAIPVVNKQNQLVGIVTHDEAIEIIRAEHTEDLEKFMGMVPAKEVMNYERTTVWRHFRKRVVWTSSLAVVGLISGIIIHSYEEALSSLIILALYMPMLADTGGNTGSQAATVIVRALALGQVSLKNWFAILFKEARISILMAAALGLIAFGKILFLSWETDVPEGYTLLFLATGISLALSIQVVSSTIIGAGLPMLVKRLGGDPAVAASPAITTVVDITGLLIYFGMATMLFF